MLFGPFAFPWVVVRVVSMPFRLSGRPPVEPLGWPLPARHSSHGLWGEGIPRSELERVAQTGAFEAEAERRWERTRARVLGFILLCLVALAFAARDLSP